MSSLKKHIVFLSRNEVVSSCIEKFFSKSDEFLVTLVIELDSLFIYLSSHNCDAVLLGSGMTEVEEKKIEEYLKLNFPSIRLIKHYGGGSGLLMNELMIAFSIKE